MIIPCGRQCRRRLFPTEEACEQCGALRYDNPPTDEATSDGRGYTITDLRELSYGWKKIIAERDIRLMEQLGSDVYFAIKAKPAESADPMGTITP